ncbi:MAG: glycosyl hydrolase, partial [Betaproteobacteria bacterium]
MRDDASPWGVASGAEWFSAYPVFNPMLKQAGVHWLRGFYEWQTIQPQQGSWNFTLPDRLLKDAQANGIHLTGVLAYFAPWASADGGTRRFPIKNIQFWRDYVTGMVDRYRSDIKYWEVWNEFNGSFAENGTPAMYAELVREASLAAKRVDSTAKIGVSVANFDVRFLDAAIKAGAGNHFDYICVHPYEILERLSDKGEPVFLSMATTLQTMLKANNQPADIPLWITEIGAPAPIKPDEVADRTQAAQLAKAYLLAIASGFKRVFWFEARGPTYGNGTDLGLIRSDMTPRPSYAALGVLTRTLGADPRPAGWLDLDDGGYGFLFDTPDSTVLAAWSPGTRSIDLTFDGNVQLSTLAGEQLLLQAGKSYALTTTPVLIKNLPAALVAKARSQKAMPFPWGGDHSGAAMVTAQLQATNVDNGVKQVRLDTTVAEAEWRRTNFSIPGNEGHYVYFWVDPQFAPLGTT